MGMNVLASWISLFACLAAAAAADVPKVEIATGVYMPMLAFGTAKTSLGNCSVHEAVQQWLQLGGRHIDTADIYGTQPDVGQGLKAAGVPREEIFITTKVPGPIGKDAVIRKILHTALPQLGVEYIDLVLIHFPCLAMGQCKPTDIQARRETWAGLRQLREQGKIRAIGVSNYDDTQVGEIVTNFREPPAVNQVQFHLAYHNETLLQAMRAAGTTLEAWAALGGPTVHGRTPTISLGDTRLQAVAQRYNVSTAQVVFRWETQKGVVPVTATCSAKHAVGDLAAFHFNLTQVDMAYLDALNPTDMNPADMIVV